MSDIEQTERGFDRFEFTDDYGEECSLQISSSAEDYKIWLGINKPVPRLMSYHINGGKPNGWVDHPLHPETFTSGRMHLTRDQVKILLPYLNKFVETGEIQ